MFCNFKDKAKQKCPKCNSTKKESLIKKVNIGGPTAAKMGNFEYRAGFNYNKATGERRAAEAASHMGSDPYNGSGIPDLEKLDLSRNEGLHHREYETD